MLHVRLGELSAGAAVLADKERRELVAASAPPKATEEHVSLLSTRRMRPGGAAVLVCEARAMGVAREATSPARRQGRR